MPRRTRRCPRPWQHSLTSLIWGGGGYPRRLGPSGRITGRQDMTEQSPNTQFHASSFLQVANADYIDQLAARYANDPASVDAQGPVSSRSRKENEMDARRQAAAPSWARADWPPAPADDLTAALTGE